MAAYCAMPMRWQIVIWIIIPLLAVAWQLDLPGKWGGFLGDSAVYMAMADSLAKDYDLQYTRDDLIRITREWPGGPQGLLLVAKDDEPDIIHYAKPVLYPLLAAPLVRYAGTNGLLIFNVLCFGFMLWCSLKCFPNSLLNQGKTSPEPPADSGNIWNSIIWSLLFWGLTAVPAYIFTLTPDLFNCALLMGGVTPWVLWEHRKPNTPLLLFISALILGIAAAARPPTGLFILLPLWSLTFRQNISSQNTGENQFSILLKQKVIPGLGVIVLFAAGAAVVFFLTKLLMGQAFSHGGFRKRIIGAMPFETPAHTFLNTGNMISTRSTKFIFHWDVLFHNIKYFFIGRFTGLIPYFFPAFMAMILALPLFKRDENEKTELLSRIPVWIVCLGLILFHLVYIPTNYHGGSCAVGNRYLISFLPAFFLLLPRAPKSKMLLGIALITAIMTGPIALNPVDAMAHYQDASKRICFYRFPPEITLLNSWPGDDPRHVRVPFEGYYAYFADDNQWGKELDGFWVKGKAQASWVIRCWKPVDHLKLRVTNGGVKNHLKGSIGKADFQKKAERKEIRYRFPTAQLPP